MPSSVAELSGYFDALVDRIPAVHYIDHEDVVDLKHMKRADRESAKAAFKEEKKRKKRAKLDPDADTCTTKLQEALSTAPAAQEAAVQPKKIFADASREELQLRLQKKIEEKHLARKAQERADTAAKSKAWKESKHKQSKKVMNKAPATADGSGDAEHAQGAQPTSATPTEAKSAAVPAGVAAEQEGYMFNNLLVNQQQRVHKKTKSKHKLLKEAEAAEEAGDEDLWDKSLKRARGDKVLDDPRLLLKAVKREHKDKAKKAAAWEERMQAQQKAQSERDQKRKQNLQERVDAKKAKSIKKREKTLLNAAPTRLGAGFEGRGPMLSW